VSRAALIVVGRDHSRGDERRAGPDRERGDLIAEAATLHLGGAAGGRSVLARAPLPFEYKARALVDMCHQKFIFQKYFKK